MSITFESREDFPEWLWSNNTQCWVNSPDWNANLTHKMTHSDTDTLKSCLALCPSSGPSLSWHNTPDDAGVGGVSLSKSKTYRQLFTTLRFSPGDSQRGREIFPFARPYMTLRREIKIGTMHLRTKSQSHNQCRYRYRYQDWYRIKMVDQTSYQKTCQTSDLETNGKDWIWIRSVHIKKTISDGSGYRPWPKVIISVYRGLSNLHPSILSLN